MVTIDGKWVMEGLEYDNPARIKTSDELSELINKIGFLPLFKNAVPGFSVEEMTAAGSWWSENQEEDPWSWREVIASQHQIAYGKLYGNRAGFVSREWYPYLAAYRRDGYDFDSRYEDGMASHRAKKVMDVLEYYEEGLLSNDMKTAAGFGKGGDKGFEGVITSLQMQTYITVCDFRRRSNKKHVEYGWPVAVYTISERLFGMDHVRSAYHLKAVEAKAFIVEKIQRHFPTAAVDEIERIIR